MSLPTATTGSTGFTPCPQASNWFATGGNLAGRRCAAGAADPLDGLPAEVAYQLLYKDPNDHLFELGEVCSSRGPLPEAPAKAGCEFAVLTWVKAAFVC